MTKRFAVSISVVLSLILTSACREDSAPLAQPAPAGGAAKPADPHAGHGHPPGEGHKEEGGAAVELGESAAGPFKVKAARDAGAIKPGAEAHIDVGVSGAPFTGVRVWIGAADGKGSMKGKGEVEHADKPNQLHAHAEIPDPLPADAKLYVEVSASDGRQHVAAFPLKP